MKFCSALEHTCVCLSVCVQGTVKQVLSFTSEEGHPQVVDLASHHLVAVSDVGFIKMWDISRRFA